QHHIVLIPGRDIECDGVARSQAGDSRNSTSACHNVALGVNSAELAPGLADNGVIASPASSSWWISLKIPLMAA
ncbi:hypothetical protein J0H33_17055, partial [bacterium]|nr:hypothetical protein [bacterium]